MRPSVLNIFVYRIYFGTRLNGCSQFVSAIIDCVLKRMYIDSKDRYKIVIGHELKNLKSLSSKNLEFYFKLKSFFFIFFSKLGAVCKELDLFRI